MNKKCKIALLIVSLVVVLSLASKISAIDYTLDQSYTATPDVGISFYKNLGSAQTFTTGVTADIGKIELLLYKVGAPTGNLWFEIWTDGETYPDTKIATSDSIDVSTVTPDIGGLIYTFYFDSGTSLTNATKYWIVNGWTGEYVEGNYVFGRIKNEGGYAGGNTFYYDIVWNPSLWDFYFLEYVHPEPTPAIINISGDMISGILASVGAIFSDLSMLFICLVGLPLGFWVIKKIIELLKARK